ncbi:MAG: hypothetical protein WD045_01070, partial [Pirellulaceae bacterium]
GGIAPTGICNQPGSKVKDALREAARALCGDFIQRASGKWQVRSSLTGKRSITRQKLSESRCRGGHRHGTTGSGNRG